MNTQAIRNQLEEINEVFGNRISENIQKNVKHIEKCHNLIRESHSAIKTLNKGSVFPAEF
jgi:hypothetical protein